MNEPTANTPRLRRLLVGAGLALAALLLAYQALASFAFEPLARRWATQWLAEHGGHRLSLERVQWRPWALALEVQGLKLHTPDGAPLLALDGLGVDLAGASLWRGALLIEAIELRTPVLHWQRGADGSSDWARFLSALAGPPQAAPTAEAASSPPRVELARLRVADGRIVVDDALPVGGFHAAIEALQFDAAGLSTFAAEPARHRLQARSEHGATLSAEGRLALAPLNASGEVKLDGLALQTLWPYLQTLLDTAPPQGRLGVAMAYRVVQAAGMPVEASLDRIRLRLQGLAVHGREAKEPALALGELALDGGRVDLGARRIEIDSLALNSGHLALKRDARGNLDLQAWLKPQPAAAPARESPGPPWRLRVAAAGIKDLALRLDDVSLAQPLAAEVARLGLALRAEAEFDTAAPRLTVEGLSIDAGGLKLASAGLPWFTLDSLKLADSRLALHERRLALGALALQGGRVELERDAKGRLVLMQALQPAQPVPPAPPAATPSPAWRISSGPVKLAGFELKAGDRSVTPAASLVLREVQAEWAAFDGDLDAPLPLSLQLKLASGGRLAARGTVWPGRPALDLNLDVAALVLAPAAPYLARYTALALRGGSLDARGRLQLAGAHWQYAGRAALRELRLDERASGAALFGFKELSSPALAVSEAGLSMGELRLDGLGGTFTIYKDRTLNLVRALSPDLAGPPAPAPPPPPPSPVATAGGRPAADSAFKIAIARLRLSHGQIDFSDLSLVLPFGARIHDLQGQIVGIANAPGARTAVELDGRVDDFGDARLHGQLQLFDPAAFMDLRLRFRNVEMTSLTPYTATFAGRRIASGKLSLTLEYRIAERQLQGENRVVMDRMVLGERVQAPGAADLPLDLAVALLQDGDGRIDLGLPVSGSLDDPQFGFGALAWKAFTTLLTRVITSPFRALAALLPGGGGEALDGVAFEPGQARLAPPEREKIVKLVQALAQRPALQLALQPGYDPAADGEALREQALRRDIGQAAGRALDEGEAPGPVVTSEGGTQAALERLFGQRFGAPALAVLRAAPASEPSLHERMLARLRAEQPLDGAALPALATQRAAGVRAALLAAGVAEARLQVDLPAERPAEGGAVALGFAARTAGAKPP
ncbi:conserved hypothetical protein [Rubrivivax sp. A210]|uniref:DUF748 domain-containing protein n=1 Tax=Rubrivivax sp. A210 TaxID=2772301 RepID=UPI00191A28A6|nr:DUF748 domain-containing protein [Rubrivivax sp. A210]CAD5374534.1 conserved hypothetical protein [Rubrivivax sp. A210]